MPFMLNIYNMITRLVRCWNPLVLKSVVLLFFTCFGAAILKRKQRRNNPHLLGFLTLIKNFCSSAHASLRCFRHIFIVCIA